MPSVTIREQALYLDPNKIWTSQTGLIVHPTFESRILPVLSPVELVPKARYESIPLHRVIPWRGASYPRRPANAGILRSTPNSQEVFFQLQTKRPTPLLTSWEHLAVLVSYQRKGEKGGLLTTSNSLANLCFMQGVSQETFLVRVFWCQGAWFLRAWSFQERIDRGWYMANWLLLPGPSP